MREGEEEGGVRSGQGRGERERMEEEEEEEEEEGEYHQLRSVTRNHRLYIYNNHSVS